MLAVKSLTTMAMPSRPPSRLYSDGPAGADSWLVLAHAPRFAARNSVISPHPRIRLIRPSPPLTQPALPALVVLHVTVRLAGAHLGEPQVELLDVRVLPEHVGAALQHDAAVLHHVAVLGDGERERGVL